MKLAVIPARGGSKRIPRKNIRNFCGKPIISYSIIQAKASALFDRIIVSTDDKEIAAVASEYGAEIPFLRPSELADDFTGTNAVVKHAIKWFQNQGESIELACCIYATAPFLRVHDLREGYNKLIASEKMFVFSVTNYASPIQRAIRINQKGEVEAIWPDKFFSRSQDLETAYHDAAQFYWGKAEAFMQDMITFSNISLPVVLPRFRVQDIDTIEDWQRAELMFTALEELRE